MEGYIEKSIMQDLLFKMYQIAPHASDEMSFNDVCKEIGFDVEEYSAYGKAQEMPDVQDFLERFPHFYPKVIGQHFVIEVDCKQRGAWLCDDEEKALKEMEYINVLSKTDYSMVCCGIASFIHKSSIHHFIK